ncbi:expressed unknown protein [Seminavis robusta]|uniref:Uncharacterized protein n=1 Tax=Seminavis robusta TaxID=568900 RepID=A0A9N8EP75_9STRA|nr:expressed unknown protein [Seminavis robusta]|eukprot:Sro1325_g262890.1 n/a (286) ;mRNA; f:11619-12476
MKLSNACIFLAAAVVVDPVAARIGQMNGIHDHQPHRNNRRLNLLEVEILDPSQRNEEESKRDEELYQCDVRYEETTQRSAILDLEAWLEFINDEEEPKEEGGSEEEGGSADADNRDLDEDNTNKELLNFLNLEKFKQQKTAQWSAENKPPPNLNTVLTHPIKKSTFQKLDSNNWGEGKKLDLKTLDLLKLPTNLPDLEVKADNLKEEAKEVNFRNGVSDDEEKFDDVMEAAFVEWINCFMAYEFAENEPAKGDSDSGDSGDSSDSDSSDSGDSSDSDSDSGEKAD